MSVLRISTSGSRHGAMYDWKKRPSFLHDYKHEDDEIYPSMYLSLFLPFSNLSNNVT